MVENVSENLARLRAKQQEPDIDPNGREWRGIKAWAERKVEKSREVIDARGIDERDSDFERGRLSALRELLALGQTEQG